MLPGIATVVESKTANPMLKQELFGWLANWFESHPPEKGMELAPLALPCVQCLDDKLAAVRKASLACLPFIIMRAGYKHVIEQANQLKPASKNTAIPLIDAAKLKLRPLLALQVPLQQLLHPHLLLLRPVLRPALLRQAHVGLLLVLPQEPLLLLPHLRLLEHRRSRVQVPSSLQLQWGDRSRHLPPASLVNLVWLPTAVTEPLLHVLPRPLPTAQRALLAVVWIVRRLSSRRTSRRKRCEKSERAKLPIGSVLMVLHDPSSSKCSVSNATVSSVAASLTRC